MASSPVKIWDLPDEVLCYIFSKLNVQYVITHVMNVCQRWESVVAKNKRFWNDVQLVIDCDYFINRGYLVGKNLDGFHKSWSFDNPHIFIGEKDLERVPKLQNIIFIEGGKIMSQSVDLLIYILDIISKNCQNVEKVEFSYCYGAGSTQAMRALREKFNRIKEIIIVTTISPSKRYPYDEISRFANLQTLVSHDRMLTSSDLYNLSEGCEHLNSLWVLLSESLRTKDILYFLEKKKKILKELGIGINLQDLILDKLKECHKLEVLFAIDARSVTDVSLKSFAHQSSLKYCSFHNAKFQQTTILDVAGPSRKPDVFKHLRILDLTGYHNYSSGFFLSWMKDSDRNSGVNTFRKDSSGVESGGFVQITFNNTSVSGGVPRYPPTSNEHWMYYEEVS